jgi:hypothetical protein
VRTPTPSYNRNWRNDGNSSINEHTTSICGKALAFTMAAAHIRGR